MKRDLYKVNNTFFIIRLGTSDVKSIKEVYGGGYRRKQPFIFDVDAGEEWLDLGANIGAFTLYALDRGAKVMAFEPDPDNFEMLSINVSTHPNGSGATLREMGVVADKKQKTAQLSQNIAKGNVWRNSMHKEWRGGNMIEVKTTFIGDYIKNRTCIKMDIEGEEMPILEWLLDSGTLSKVYIPKLVFEWSFDIDPDLDRFRSVMSKLGKHFDAVIPTELYKGEKEWNKAWFPPCTTIFCLKMRGA